MHKTLDLDQLLGYRLLAKLQVNTGAHNPHEPISDSSNIAVLSAKVGIPKGIDGLSSGPILGAKVGIKP